MKLAKLYILASYVACASTMGFIVPIETNNIDSIKQGFSINSQNLNDMVNNIATQSTARGTDSDLYSCVVKAVVSFVACMHSDNLQEQTDPLPFLKCLIEVFPGFVKCFIFEQSSKPVPDKRTNIRKQ